MKCLFTKCRKQLHSSFAIFHSAVCLTTFPHPLPKRVLHRARSSAPPFILPYPLFSLKSSSSCLLLRLRLPVTYIFHSIFPSLMYFRRQFLRRMLPIQLVFLIFDAFRTVFLNFRAAARYWALASIIPGRERPKETTICYKISLVQLITNLNIILYLSTCHTVYISVLKLFMIMT